MNFFLQFYLTEPRRALQPKCTQWFPRIGPYGFESLGFLKNARAGAMRSKTQWVAWTTKSPIVGNHWVALGCRLLALLSMIEILNGNYNSAMHSIANFRLEKPDGLWILEESFRKNSKTEWKKFQPEKLKKVNTESPISFISLLFTCRTI